MIYKDRFLGEIELTKIGETPMRHMMGCEANEMIYKDERDNIYIDFYNSLSDPLQPRKIDLVFLPKILVNKIKEVV